MSPDELVAEIYERLEAIYHEDKYDGLTKSQAAYPLVRGLANVLADLRYNTEESEDAWNDRVDRWTHVLMHTIMNHKHPGFGRLD